MNRVQRIGADIRAARRRYRLTQEQLADLAGTSTRTVRDIEHGTGTTGIGTVAEVADVLGLTLELHG
ncbi:helix-turn-helix domain-containing protein [Nocardia zapadnayensis]|uniref:helix-turn-helix domain-containing protein n=1 Tax=Nocardia TaxID=1817 RepID=UPI0007A49707|nr:MULTISPECIES: helix-turn-helix domain-containing protein [Nocardia]MCX0274652.1 helix-turn-helix domain-containing protein [Nocardia zapadnayensis]